MENVDGFVSLKTYKQIMREKDLSFRELEEEIFKQGFTPLRFQPNQNSITQKEQYKLFSSHVCIVGCGGLGGNVAELLARVGVGELTLVDDDVFSEHNLNRQKFSSIKTLGCHKAKVLANELEEINPALQSHVKPYRADEKSIDDITKNVDIVVDCADNSLTKALLSNFCKQANIAFVHGAIAGWMMQTSSSTKIATLYKDKEQGAEKISGNLAFTASLCASMQASICIKLLLDKKLDDDELIFFDLLDTQIEKVLL